MTDHYEPLSPVQIERKLTSLVSALTMAQQALAQARNDEVAAKHEYESARRRAFFSPDCPKVSRGGYTTADRDAWVEEQAAEEQRTYDLAEVKRKTAEDHLRVVRDQASIVQSQGASVRQAYSMAGAA